MQGRLEDWDGDDSGFTWDVSDADDTLLPITVIISTPIAAVVFYVLFSKLRGVVEESPTLKFLYGLEIPAMVITFVEFVTSFLLLADCQTLPCVVKALTTILLFLFGIINVLYLITDEVSKVKQLNNVKFFDKIFYIVEKFLSNLVFFKILIALISVSIIPIILLITVHPAEILCTILMYFAAIIKLTLFLTIVSVLSTTCIHVNGEGAASIKKDCEEKVGWYQRKWNKLYEFVKSKKTQDTDGPQSDREKDKDVHKKATRRILVLVGIFNVALFVLLIGFLYMQALLSGATSSTIINYVLIIITALVPGALVYGAKHALKGTEPDAQNVNVIKDDATTGVTRVLEDIKTSLERWLLGRSDQQQDAEAARRSEVSGDGNSDAGQLQPQDEGQDVEAARHGDDSHSGGNGNSGVREVTVEHHP